MIVKNLYEMLFVQIERKREEMIFLGTQHGLTSPEVIKASQQLDHILNNLNHLKNYTYQFK
ncbi:aspartyl-phosphate phosphatase Spo0E family protein [Metabacillus litoralis]|jgi:hypothetical protein|uniref:Aspartyl-phosphate phosphatase Spo0E family protein n=1 Tax=Metabacillus rhizolycopersici TaxID=2875709 RepID=A0ABS7UZN4_9BACI|nr:MULTISPECIES: aspartyl-phosphate phosphatase Spo0E family protein [Metabacillus]MBZ5753781.1 aspartyl-phosphate phosphatase Spo0E family protein [Metabacillus rhizolycopersici]MCM3655538.1 aspartyl-phosphate phosphatase Spo0E family protein [Metabacillus litoralis]